MADDDGGVDRRSLLAATGVAGAAALAGCVGEEGDGSGNVTDGSGPSGNALTPPSAPPVPDDQYWAYVVQSLQYQNHALEQLIDDGG